MKWKDAALLIITNDETLVKTLGGKLQEWGAFVYHYEPGYASIMPEKMIDVILVDVRSHTEEVLQRLSCILGEMPFTETILINSSNNISASMAGMRAGASDELTVPFDTEKLKKVLNAAFGRSRNRQKNKKRRSLFAVFGEAMSAATFAQAGEFEMARDILNGSNTRKNQDNIIDKKKNNPK